MTQPVAEYRHGKLSGLLILGNISHDRLKSIPLRQIALLSTDGNCKTWNHQPTEKEVSAARTEPKCKPQPTLIPKLQRKADETASEHYERVASYYLRAASISGKPLVDISNAACVPKSTAARWVREARRRGLLPATTKGKY